MAYIIGGGCINCGECENVCPASAILEADGARVIDAASCIDCGTCVAVCPAEVISQG